MYKMKKILYIIGIICIFGSLPNSVFGALPYYSSEQTMLPFQNNSYDLGTSTSIGGVSRWWRNIFYRGSLINDLMTDGCASWASGVLTSLGVPCGSGGGSGGGTWSTTTSTVSGQLFNYPNNATDIVTIGSNSSTTAEFFFDPNTNLFKTVDIVTKSPYVDARYYTSLSAAVTAIGTATSTLLVPNSQNITSNLTIPANITLKFIGTGMLNLSNGVTVTILGQIEAGFQKIFNNAVGGMATTSFGTGQTTQKEYYTAWWGPDTGWSGDAQPALQAAIDAMPLHATLKSLQCQKYLIGNTLNMNAKAGLIFQNEPPNHTVSNCGIKWNGPDGGTMVNIHRTADSKLVGWTFIASTTATAAGKVIDIDLDSGTGFTTTNNWIIDNAIYTSPASSTFKAISISETATSNNEFMHFIDNEISGAGTYQGYGIYMGASSNAHGHTFYGNTIYSFEHNIHSVNGSFGGTFNNFGGADYDLYIENVSYPSFFEYVDSENSRHFAYLNGNTYPIRISNSRIMGPGYAGDGFIVFGPLAKYIELSGNIYGGDDSAYTYDASGANNLHLTSTNNRFASSPTKTEADNYHGFYPPTAGAVLTRNDPGFYTATSTTWANQQIVRDVTLSYPSPGLNAGDIHISPSSAGHVSNNSNSITFGANSSGYYDQAVAGIYVQTSQNPPTNSTMYFGTTNSYSAGPQIGMTLSPTRNLGVGTTSPYAKLSVVGQAVAAYFTATTSTASTFPYASSTALTVSGALYNSGLSDGCLNVTSGLIGSTGSACGSGGGGGTGAWSTTTVATGLIVYPNNNTDVVNIGSNSTSTGSFWFNPITQVAYIKGLGVNQPVKSASYVLDVSGAMRSTGTGVLGNLDLGAGWAYWAQGAAGGIGMGSGQNHCWKAATTATSNTGCDVGISRYAAGVLAIGNGTAGNATGTLITSVIGVGTTSPYAMLSVAGQVVGAYFTATTTTASTFPYASTTALSATSLCISTDCRTAWPTGGSGSDPFTHTSVYGQTTSATSTLLALTGSPFSLVASSTVNFENASTTLLSVSNIASTTDLIISGLGGASTRCLEVGTDGTVSANASACGTGGGGLGWASTTAPDSNSIYSTQLSNVGIGTTSPYAKLSVVGPVVSEYFDATSTTATSTLPILQTGLLSTQDDPGAVTLIDIPIVSAVNGTVESGAFSIDNTPVLTVKATSNGSGGVTASSQQVHIAGSLGIANTSPAYPLDITGQMRTTQVAHLNEVDVGGGWWYLSQGASGGIGFGSGHNTCWKSATTATNNTGCDIGLSRLGIRTLGVGSGAAGSFNGSIITERLGLGTSTPFAVLSVSATSTTDTRALFAVATSTGTASTTVYRIDKFGHRITGGTAPTVSSCGTSPSVVGNDNAGKITIGTSIGVDTSCTVTFNNAWPNAPACIVNNETSALTARYVDDATSVSAMTINVNTAFADSDVISYQCIGY